MSTMLEQAIVDATALKEAAVKNAEALVVEKYSDEVKGAITRLLEEDELDMFADPQEEEVSTTTMEQVPMAHEPSVDEETFVEVNLDDIIAAVKKDEPSAEDAIEGEMDVEQVAAVMDSEDGSDMPANRDDEEIDINETDLVNMFKEMLTVDVPAVELERSRKRADEAANHPDEIEADETLQSTKEKEETIYTDGMDSEDIEEYEKTMAKNESLRKDNEELCNLLEQVKNKLQEMSLQNARLLYANRVLNDPSLNEQQKTKIAELVSDARTVEEAKMVYETLQKTMATTTKSHNPQSLSEVVSRSSSVVLAGHRREDSTNNSPKGAPTYNRWAILAGMKKD